MISTQELEHQIRESEEPAVLSEDVFLVPNLAGYLSGLLHRHGSTVQEVVVGCNLDRSYGYQLFNGTRRPTRDFLLRLALLLRLSEAEAQQLLKIAGRQPLYARSRRDAAVLYGLSHGLSAEKTQELLAGLGEAGLAGESGSGFCPVSPPCRRGLRCPAGSRRTTRRSPACPGRGTAAWCCGCGGRRTAPPSC